MTSAIHSPGAPRRVSDLMSRDVVTISPDASVRELARLLGSRGVSGVPVVTEGGRLLGTVSVTDLLWEGDRLLPLLGQDDAPDSEGGSPPAPGTVRELMTPDVFGLEPMASIRELLEFFSRTGLHRVPVVADEELVGIVSATDLLELVTEPEPDEEAG